VAADEGFFCGGEVEDAEGFAGILVADGGECGEEGVYGEAGADDFLFRDAPAAHCFEGCLIGDEEEIGGSTEPGGVDFDGVSDDGEDGDFFADFLVVAFEEVRIDRVSGGDGGGLVFADESLEVALGVAHEREVGI
jgi:hypothetical protein